MLNFRQILKTSLQIVLQWYVFSLSIPGGDQRLKTTYADLLPPTPRIIDPVNPANNMYLSGVGPVDYGPGDGKWSVFAKKVNSIDLK